MVRVHMVSFCLSARQMNGLSVITLLDALYWYFAIEELTMGKDALFH